MASETATTYDAREDLVTIVWGVLVQFDELDDVDEVVDLIVDSILANGWPRTDGS